MTSGIRAVSEGNFLKEVVAFPNMPGGDERELLLRVSDRLCAELGGREGAEDPPQARSARERVQGMAGVLSPTDEEFVADVRRKLARIAAAAAEPPTGAMLAGAAGAALDGIEMMIRGELVSGKPERLPTLMPGFVFLATLPYVDQDEALALSRRTGELVTAERQRHRAD